MPAPPKTLQIRAFGSCARGGLALGAAVGILALLTFGAPKSVFWDSSPVPKPQDWAGHLERPAERAAAAPEPLTSASYTTGFDKAAVAPLSPVRAPLVRDSDACPSALNCAFRTAQGAPRPAVAPAPIAPVVAPAPPANPGPFAALASRLPAPQILLKPFGFVADTFTGLVKKL